MSGFLPDEKIIEIEIISTLAVYMYLMWSLGETYIEKIQSSVNCGLQAKWLKSTTTA